MDIYTQIDKPTLLLDEQTARANIRRMARKAADQRVRFRPHFKTHQSAEIGEWFRSEGVSAITVSSVDMARYFVDHGWQDITLAFSTNLRQVHSIVDLAHRAHIELLVESKDAVEALQDAADAPLDLWIKIDVGSHRTGLAPDDREQVLSLARAVQRTPNLRLCGLLTHTGQTYNASSPAEALAMYTDSAARMNSIREFLSKHHIRDLEISIGDTPGCSLCETFGNVDEIRPGNFVFYDAQMMRVGACSPAQIAAAVACPVVAKHSARGEVVLYGGAVHLSKDYLMLGDQRTYGLPAFPQGRRWSDPLPGGFVRGLSQEHGMVHLEPADFDRVRVGDLLVIIPAHVCLAVWELRSYLTLDGKKISILGSSSS
jgi:D-serine deaminase-like pyridoxal phosphate-dependent protein